MGRQHDLTGAVLRQRVDRPGWKRPGGANLAARADRMKKERSLDRDQVPGRVPACGTTGRDAGGGRMRVFGSRPLVAVQERVLI